MASILVCSWQVNEVTTPLSVNLFASRILSAISVQPIACSFPIYDIPLTVLSEKLHWLVSKNLFLARVAAFDSDGNEIARSISTVGYSCIAIITVIILSTIVVVLGILNRFRTYRPDMPLVGSRSAAISVACHRQGKTSMLLLSRAMGCCEWSRRKVGRALLLHESSDFAACRRRTLCGQGCRRKF